MMDKEKLYRFFQGGSTLQEEMEIRKWMERSPANQKVFLQERKFFDSLILLHDPQKTFRRSSLIRRIREWIPMRTLLQTAATVAVTVVVSLLLLGQDPPPPQPTMLSLEVPAGQRIQCTLSDGTVVWLNSRSRMEYPGIFNENTREITLEGEAYFEVMHQPERPFIVHTTYGDIEVLGTTFDVEAYSEEHSFTTALIEGSVQIKRDNETILLEPYQQASLQEGKLQISSIDDMNTYRWKEGLICFRDESFGQILKKFEKYYNVVIHLAPGTDTNTRYTGKFRQEDGVESALRILQKDIRFAYKRDPHQPIIHIK